MLKTLSEATFTFLFICYPEWRLNAIKIDFVSLMWLISGLDLLTFLKNKSNDVIPWTITNKFRYKSPFF